MEILPISRGDRRQCNLPVQIFGPIVIQQNMILLGMTLPTIYIEN